MIEALLFIVIGFLLGLLGVILIESVRKPKLRIYTESGGLPAYGCNPNGRWVFLHVKVENCGHGKWFRWLPTRYSAALCRAWITFCDSNKKNLFTVDGRWPSTGQPLALTWTGQRVENMFWDSLVPQGMREDIPPGADADLDIAVKWENDPNCHAFNNWSYAYPLWRNPKWELGTGEFIIEVKVVSGEVVKKQKFRLYNMGTSLADFKLESV